MVTNKAIIAIVQAMATITALIVHGAANLAIFAEKPSDITRAGLFVDRFGLFRLSYPSRVLTGHIPS